MKGKVKAIYDTHRRAVDGSCGEHTIPFPWEVILVDNASSDATGRLAQELWPQDAPAPLRVVHEARLGLAYARRLGISIARYELLSFVDDDNWVSRDWVQLVWEFMSEHPEAGACSGFCDAECEIPPPGWFQFISEMYSVNRPEEKLEQRAALCGAGLTLRKSALLELDKKGFRTWLVDRQGMMLTAGEDSELCLALHLAGWQLWYEPRLRLRHFLPANRLEWSYLRRLARGAGLSSPALDGYFFAMKPKRTGVTRLLRRVRETWSWQLLSVLRKLSWQLLKLVSSLWSPMEGDIGVLHLERQSGRCLGLLQMRRHYGARIREIRTLFQQSCWLRRNGQLPN
ncbi:MAG: hypothetical protein DMG32_27735 [Acidobacteria bacterium]|nr:MAG: hypothetical protein DMG32_27735 [Acidobacteriota bacterium]